MRWVKASERLPEDKWEIVCIKTDGGGAAYYQSGDRASIEHEMETYIPTLHAYETQWLDESDQSEDRDKWISEYEKHAKSILTGLGYVDFNTGTFSTEDTWTMPFDNAILFFKHITKDKNQQP